MVNISYLFAMIYGNNVFMLCFISLFFADSLMSYDLSFSGMNVCAMNALDKTII